MPTSSGLRRLLQLRETEERDKQVRFASLVEQLRHLKAARDVAELQEKSGRALVRKSALTGETQDRYIGLAEIFCSSANSKLMSIRIEQTSATTSVMKAELVRKHREKKQVEILIRRELERETEHSRRRAQLELDDWARLSGSEEEAIPIRPADSIGLPFRISGE
ncbi:MAG TPA: hypothetical protein VN753_02920 [Terracidiphilus sp.]|jgi:hypothetical protein|nr:hypothetical protein [Terracidiphilus sp.]